MSPFVYIFKLLLNITGPSVQGGEGDVNVF